VNVAVVTGASRNLGRSIALALGRAGHHVVVNTRSDLAAAEAVATEIRQAGGKAEAVAADVGDPGAVDALFARAAELGRVTVLVNNASVRARIPARELTVADWEVARRVTLDGAFHCVLSALPALTDGGGAIVNVLGANAMNGDPDRVAVSAAKFGLLGLTRALAEALRADRVTVNAVSPARMESGEPARAEVAATVAWLASPAGHMLTGEALTVGGRE
jgi:3-oxoacyl-[acyl-carrier protein] reductase